MVDHLENSEEGEVRDGGCGIDELFHVLLYLKCII